MNVILEYLYYCETLEMPQKNEKTASIGATTREI